MPTHWLHLVLSAASVLSSRAESPICAETGFGYKSVLLTVNGGFLADASACQAACGAKIDCAFFTYYPSSTACWLQGPEAVRGQDTADVVSGPKECPSDFTTTSAAQLEAVSPDTVVVQEDSATVPPMPSVPPTPVPLPGTATLGPATAPVLTVAPSSTTFLAAAETTTAETATTTSTIANVTVVAASDHPDTVGGSASGRGAGDEIRSMIHVWGWVISAIFLCCVIVSCTYCKRGGAKSQKAKPITRGVEFEGKAEELQEQLSFAEEAPLMPAAPSPYAYTAAPMNYYSSPVAPMTVTKAPTVITTPSISIAPAKMSVAKPMQTAEFGAASAASTSALPTSCSQCGNVYAADAKFCRMCGKKRE
mmetsp:Transcript_4904/g.8746  ORF Transcript_4904/g.8746 Transcript_4904/m.8746 type:complete len:365 (-) Transcript_4904:43-1137(-)